jgi:hypothetical protein
LFVTQEAAEAELREILEKYVAAVLVFLAASRPSS